MTKYRIGATLVYVASLCEGMRPCLVIDRSLHSRKLKISHLNPKVSMRRPSTIEESWSKACIIWIEAYIVSDWSLSTGIGLGPIQYQSIRLGPK